MSMRISDANGCALLLLLAACGRGSDDPRVTAGAIAEGDSARGRIACRLGDAASYSESCTAERTAVAGGQVLTLRGPDGGFHRLRVDGQGGGVAAADGAEPVMVTAAAGGATEVAFGTDRYRLPAAGVRTPAATSSSPPSQ